MASNLSIRLLAEPIRSIAAAAIDDQYSAIGAPFDHPVRILRVSNLTDETLMFSFDGQEDHFILISNDSLSFDITTNKTSIGGTFSISKGTTIYVKEVDTTPTTGAVYVSVFYGKE